MGKRINLAQLAQEEVQDYSAPAAVPAPEPAAAPVPAQGSVSLLTVSGIVANPLNQRVADEEGSEFQELVATIRGHGVLQPIVVCSAAVFVDRYPGERAGVAGADWVALIGNRRLRAAVSAGLAQIPALVNDNRVASMYEVMLVENSHRKALGPLHEAEAMQRLLVESGISQRALAGRIGRTPMYVSQRMALLGLVPALRTALEDGTLTVEQARRLGGLSAPEQDAVVAAGPPYRGPVARRSGATPRARRSISVSSPARAAASILEVFTEAERAELIRLLSEPDGATGACEATTSGQRR